MSNTDYRQQIKNLQRQKGIGTWALSRRAGITPSTLYNYLGGRSQMTAGNLARVMDALNAIPDKSLDDKELQET
jgi:predicted transcriptional regulator